MTLTDWQFELGGVEFGVGQGIGVSKFTRGGSDTRNQDQPSGFGDWVNFGTDRKTPGVWNWELFTDLSNATDALAAMETLESVWDAEDVRDTPGAVMPLRYRVNGRTRRVFGRPRRFTSTPQELTPKGKIEAVADFQLAEGVYYDDAELSVTLGVGATQVTGRGFTFPLTFPVLVGSTAGDARSRNIAVGGTRKTWLTATITGPIVNPYLIVGGALINGKTVGGGVLQLQGTIPAGASNAVTVSSLPWAQGVYRKQDGTSAPVYLSATSALSMLRVTPGQHLLTFGGISDTGAATCVVSCRNAYASY